MTRFSLLVAIARIGLILHGEGVPMRSLHAISVPNTGKQQQMRHYLRRVLRMLYAYRSLHSLQTL